MTTWFLIADAYHAEIWVQEDHKHWELGRVLTPSVHHRFSREVGSDRPGRANASTESRRSSIELHEDLIDAEHRNFAREVTVFLTNAFMNGSFGKLAVIAAPRMLGFLREERDKKLASAITIEVAKDLVKSPAAEKLAQFNALLS